MTEMKAKKFSQKIINNHKKQEEEKSFLDRSNVTKLSPKN